MTSLYRTYRPKTFAELTGQETIVRTLHGALSSGRIGHAYLFCGPRGTGKTTMARLFAKAINCETRKSNNEQRITSNEPCNQCHSCTQINEGRSLDLVEVDAASNTGVDNVRELIESSRVAAPSGGYKVFLIDEVHMLSKSAFNALLKTLEEPPKHVVFILATTEPHKVPETIISRVQRFDFRKIAREELLTKLRKIAKNEKLTIDDGSLELVVAGSGGSFRDAESLLSKIMAFSGDTITEKQTSSLLGIIPERTHEKFLASLLEKKSSSALEMISDLHESGANMEQFCIQFIAYARKKMVDGLNDRAKSNDPSFDPHRYVTLIEAFMLARNDLKTSPIPQLPLELAVIELTK